MSTRLLSWCCVVGWVLVAYLVAAAVILDGDDYGDRYAVLVVGFGVLAGAVAIPSSAFGLALLSRVNQQILADQARDRAEADDLSQG
ncbi:hypothetical protein [Nocardioides flavescens]|uniref:DUF4282 domain-containing protein n=1 Tax=Nocardioides flavescens TaxID=2691959 RepID=A0A6L7EXZ6_9ACTN|nr:hypothetical protein [Nocardioides flavescens]MXG90428.1 hypothetical protein [Nocardioides flavescens]